MRGNSLQFLFVDNEVNDFLRYRMALARRLKKLGFEVHVALPSGDGVSEIKNCGIRVHEISLRPLNTSLWQEFKTFISLFTLYRELRPIMVHHLSLKPVLYGGIVARMLGMRSVVSTITGLGPLFTSRSPKMRCLRYLTEVGLRFAYSSKPYYLTVQNPEDRSFLLAKRVAPQQRISIIKGSGVDLSLFTKKAEPGGPPIVLMAGRLIWEKGVGEFVAAAKRSKASGLKARFLLVGEIVPEHPSAISESVLEEWHKTGHVEWLNWRDDMPHLLSQCHIVCLPTYYAEGIPRILIEAAASGRPIITTNSPGCREVVHDGENGFLVPPRSPDALADTISKLVLDGRLRATFGNKGRDIAVKEFSIDQAVDSYFKVYSQASKMGLAFYKPPVQKGNPGKDITESVYR